MLDNDVYCKLNKQFKKTKRSLLRKIIIKSHSNFSIMLRKLRLRKKNVFLLKKTHIDRTCEIKVNLTNPDVSHLQIGKNV